MKKEVNMNDFNFNKAFAIYYKWQLIGNVAFVAIAFMLGAISAAIGMDEDTSVAVAVSGGLIMMVWAYIIGMIKMARTWPVPGDVRGFWSGLKVVALNISLLGYRHITLKNLPWKTVMTWGLVATFFSTSLVQVIPGGVEAVLGFLIVVVVMIPVVITIMWGIGKGFGLIFNK